MSQNRLVVGLIVALLVGILTARYVFVQLRKARVAATKEVPMGQIVVAAKQLQMGQRLERTDVREMSWPLEAKPPGAFVRIDDCLDRAVTTAFVENEPILENELAPKGGGGGLSVAIPEGMRALSVRVDDVVSVAGFVVSGTVVDVLVTGAAMNGDVVTRTILQDLRVMAVGQKVEQDPEGKPQIYTVVTLLVAPDQAVKLTMASTEGRIRLALRNSMDSKEVNPPPVDRSSLFAAGTPPPTPAAPKATGLSPRSAPKPAPEVYVVDVILGNKHENQSFAGRQ